MKTVGLVEVLSAALVPYGSKIVLAFVYGSVAQGTYTAKSDVDLMIVGNLDVVDLHRAIVQVEDKLRRTVNYSLFSPEEFRMERDNADSFVSSVLSGPKLLVIGKVDVTIQPNEEPLDEHYRPLGGEALRRVEWVDGSFRSCSS